MKLRLIICSIFLAFAHTTYCQNQKVFRKSYWVKRGNNCFYTTYFKNEGPRLQKISKGKKKVDTLYLSTSGMDTTVFFKPKYGKTYSDLETTDISGFTDCYLFGDIKQEKGKLLFYPFPVKGNTTDVLNSDFKNLNLAIKIPYRRVVKVPFYAWQFGALTIPLKIYTGTEADRLVNHVQTDLNLNVMGGFRWGKERFYQLPNEDKGMSYEGAWSVNAIAGLSKIVLNSGTTTPALSEEYSVAALNYGFALGRQHNSIGFYLAGGWDTPLGGEADNWNFKNKFWWGLAIGIGI